MRDFLLSWLTGVSQRCRRRFRARSTSVLLFCSSTYSTEVFIVCCLLQMVGAILIAVGLWLQFDRRYMLLNALLRQMPGSPILVAFDEQYASWAVVGIGCAVLVLSFVGCCGACAESAGFLCFVSKHRRMFFLLFSRGWPRRYLKARCANVPALYSLMECANSIYRLTTDDCSMYTARCHVLW